MKKIIIISIFITLSLIIFAGENGNKKIIRQIHLVKAKPPSFSFSGETGNLKKDIYQKVGFENDSFFWAGTFEYQGFLTIYDDYTYKCEFCTEKFSEHVERIFSNALNKNDGIFTYKEFALPEGDPEGKMGYYKVFLHTGDKNFDKALIEEFTRGFLFRELDPKVGEKYLQNKWRKEQNKNELLDAIYFIGGDIIVERAWPYFWKWNIIKSFPFTEEEIQKNKYIGARITNIIL